MSVSKRGVDVQTEAISLTHDSLAVVDHHVEHRGQLVGSVLFHCLIDDAFLHVHHYRQRRDDLKIILIVVYLLLPAG